MFNNIMGGLLEALGFFPLLFMVIGTTAGIFVGAIPGLTGAMLIALLLPVTFYMEPINALVFIVGVYVGCISGGLVTATLLRIPGTVSSLVTTFDGYPMARNGRPGRALGIGIFASLFGGLTSAVVLISLAQPLSIWATRFSPFDLFSLIMLAFALVTFLSEGAMIKGLLSCALGFLVTFPGIDPSSAQGRLTFGFVVMNTGLPMLPFFVGMFAVGTILGDVLKMNKSEDQGVEATREGMFLKVPEWKQQGGNLIRSSAIGAGIGILPGIGSNIASMVSYVAAKTMSKTPEKFGTGIEEGIVASEAANNAAVGGALVPTLAIGLPGSFVDVLLLAAFLIHDLQPGPLLFYSQPHLAYGVIWSYFLANIVMFFIMIGALKFMARMALFPRYYLFPIIIVFSVIGAFALENTAWALWVMLFFGFLGFIMERLDIPLVPFAMAYVLGPLAEQKLRLGLQITGGSYAPLLTEPLSAILLVIAVSFFLWPLLRQFRGRKKTDHINSVC